MILELALPTLCLVMAGGLIWLARREGRARARWRAQLLRCEDTQLDECRIVNEQGDFPTLQGNYLGHPVQFQLICDDLTFRKLPNLWLSLSVKANLDYPTLDIIAREQNTEFYAWGSRLDHRLRRPEGWPGALSVHCARAQAPLDTITEHVCAFFSDPRAKELLITHTGVRLVIQLEQARRAEYLVLRVAQFDLAHVPTPLTQHLLSSATALIDTLMHAQTA